MAYTLEQLQSMGATPVSGQGSYTLDQLKSLGATPVDNTPETQPSALSQGLHAIANTPGSLAKFAYNSSVNPFVQLFKQAPGAFGAAKDLIQNPGLTGQAFKLAGQQYAKDQTAGNVLLAKNAIKSVSPTFVPQLLKGDFKGATQSIVDDPAQVLQAGLLLRGGAEGIDALRGDTAVSGALDTGAKSVLSGVDKLGQTVSEKGTALTETAKVSLRNRYIKQSTADWQRPADSNQPSLRKSGDILENAKDNNIPERIAKNGIQLSDNVEEGKYATSNTADKIRAENGKLSSELLRPSLQMADYSTPRTPVADLTKATIADIKSSKLTTPGDMETQITKAQTEGEALQRKYPNGMSLTDLHDEKISYASNRYSPVGPKSDANAANVDRAFGRSLAEGVEKGFPEAKLFNQELQKQYQAADYLESIDGKKVPQTLLSKVAKKTAQLTGAGIGGTLGGIPGEVGGYVLGGMLESVFENMPNPVKGAFLDNLQRTNSPAFEAVKKYLGDQQTMRLMRKKLGGPTPLGSEKNPIILPAPTTFEASARNTSYNKQPQYLQLPGPSGKFDPNAIPMGQGTTFESPARFSTNTRTNPKTGTQYTKNLKTGELKITNPKRIFKSK